MNIKRITITIIIIIIIIIINILGISNSSVK